MDLAEWLMKSKPTEWLSPLVTAIGFIFLYGQLRASTRQAETAASNYDLAQRAARRSASEAAEQQKWKKAEFLAEQVKDFYADKRIERVTYMLDWWTRKFPVDGQEVMIVHDEKADEHARRVYRSYTELEQKGQVAIITKALRKHDVEGFTEREQWVRDEFDWLFFRLDQFQHLIDSKLVSFAEVDIHLKYTLDLLTGGKSWVSGDMVETLARYIELYDFEAARKLIRSRIEARKSSPAPAAG